MLPFLHCVKAVLTFFRVLFLNQHSCIIHFSMHFVSNVFKNVFHLENKTLSELKEEIEKRKKMIKNRDQLVCALADQSRDEVK